METHHCTNLCGPSTFTCLNHRNISEKIANVWRFILDKYFLNWSVRFAFPIALFPVPLTHFRINIHFTNNHHDLKIYYETIRLPFLQTSLFWSPESWMILWIFFIRFFILEQYTICFVIVASAILEYCLMKWTGISDKDNNKVDF